MSDFRNIFKRAAKLLDENLKKELRQQGHFNTGALELSITSKITVNGSDTKLEGQAADYAGILNDGTRPEKASMAQFPFLKEFFISKGVEPKKAGAYAAMTIHRWQKEGMSTKASVRFSKNGKRLKFIELVAELIDSKLDKVVTDDIDKVVDKEYKKQKSETI